jgi:hypothetical protein
LLLYINLTGCGVTHTPSIVKIFSLYLYVRILLKETSIQFSTITKEYLSLSMGLVINQSNEACPTITKVLEMEKNLSLSLFTKRSLSLTPGHQSYYISGIKSFRHTFITPHHMPYY